MELDRPVVGLGPIWDRVGQARSWTCKKINKIVVLNNISCRARRPLGESPSVVDKSPGRQAKPQLLAVWWLLKQITAPGPRPRSSTNDLAPPRRMGWVFLQPYQTR